MSDAASNKAGLENNLQHFIGYHIKVYHNRVNYVLIKEDESQ